MNEKLSERVAGIEKWLDEQKFAVKVEQAHLRDGTKERAYWHYGYMVALKDVLGLLGNGETRQ